MEINLSTVIMMILTAALGLHVWYIKRMMIKAERSLSREQIEKLVDIKLAPVDKLQDKLHSDLARIENKLDSLIARN